MTDALRVTGLHFTYDGTELLDGLDLEIAGAEVVCLVGPSGSGKTSLLRCIAGLEAPASGTVSLDGAVLDGVPTHRRRIGMMFQEPALFPHLDVLGNVAFGRPDLAPEERRRDALEHLAMVGLEDRARAAVDELSGGQRQRVALARTLAARPRAVLLDEPLAALDPELREDLGARIKALLAGQGVPVLWVTHDPAEAARIGDRIVRMQGGRCVPA